MQSLSLNRPVCSCYNIFFRQFNTFLHCLYFLRSKRILCNSQVFKKKKKKKFLVFRGPKRCTASKLTPWAVENFTIYNCKFKCSIQPNPSYLVPSLVQANAPLLREILNSICSSSEEKGKSRTSHPHRRHRIKKPR